MRNMLKMVSIGLVSLVLAGCSVRLLDFTAISSKNCDIQGTRGERVQGKDMAWLILGIPTGMPMKKEALDRAIERCNGDLLVDGVVYQKGWFALLVGQSGYVIEGTCVNTKRK